MSHKVEAKELFFPIIISDVLTNLPDSDKLIKFHGKHVLINGNTYKPISVVSDIYEIIKNEEAFEYGKKCLKELFDLKESEKIEIYNINASSNFSFCHIDLISRNNSLSIMIKDEYLPFIRITNSYNSMFKLSFRIGIYRIRCSNGSIFEDESIKIDFDHIKGAKKQINLGLKKEDLQNILNKFDSDIHCLINAKIPLEYYFPIFCKGLNLNFDLNSKNEKKKNLEIEKLNITSSFFKDKFKKYKDETNNDCYTLYNVMTEAATYGIDRKVSFVNRVNRNQMRVGSWLNSFTELIRKGDIDYKEYLKDYLELIKN